MLRIRKNWTEEFNTELQAHRSVTSPGFGPPCAQHGYSIVSTAGIPSYEGPHNGSKVKAQGRVCDGGPAVELVLLFASFFAAALARQRFLYTLLLARLEVEGVTLHFLNYVLLLHFALEAAQGVL